MSDFFSKEEDLPPQTEHFEISCQFHETECVQIALHTDQGAVLIDETCGDSDPFTELALSALAVVLCRCESTKIIADHEPGETLITVVPKRLDPRTKPVETRLLEVGITHSCKGHVASFSVRPDLFSRAVRSFLVQIRDEVGLDKFYDSYRGETFPSKALAALEAAIDTPTIPRLGPEDGGYGAIRLTHSAEPDESKTDD